MVLADCCSPGCSFVAVPVANNPLCHSPVARFPDKREAAGTLVAVHTLAVRVLDLEAAGVGILAARGLDTSAELGFDSPVGSAAVEELAAEVPGTAGSGAAVRPADSDSATGADWELGCDLLVDSVLQQVPWHPKLDSPFDSSRFLCHFAEPDFFRTS